MKDFTKFKHHLQMATDALTSINDEVQGLPDQSDALDTVVDTLNTLIQGFVEFKLEFDTAYEPFKSLVEKRIENARQLQQIIDEGSE